jgi:hypothetical protein
VIGILVGLCSWMCFYGIYARKDNIGSLEYVVWSDDNNAWTHTRSDTTTPTSNFSTPRRRLLPTWRGPTNVTDQVLWIIWSLVILDSDGMSRGEST